MTTYSIKDLEQLSGIKAHTLRIWEQRYKFIVPKRTETNIRYYDDNDLKLVLNIALLKENGYKISKIAAMSREEMHSEVLRLTEDSLHFPDQIQTLTLAMIDLDEEQFNKIINNNIFRIGFEKTMINIVFPFLAKIGYLWQTGAICPAQEHFVSHLIRQKLFVAIDEQFVSGTEKTPKYVLYLPEGELHELTLLFVNYILRTRKNKVIYLGQTLPFEDLKLVYDIHKPDFILTVITSSPPASEIQQYIERLSETFRNATMLVSGYQVVAQDIKIKKNVKIFTRIEHIISFAEANSLEQTTKYK